MNDTELAVKIGRICVKMDDMAKDLEELKDDIKSINRKQESWLKAGLMVLGAGFIGLVTYIWLGHLPKI